MKRRLIAMSIIILLGLSVAIPLTVSVQGVGPQYDCHYSVTLDGQVISQNDFVSEIDATNTVQKGPSVVTVTCNAI